MSVDVPSTRRPALTAAEVRALINRPADPERKEAFLRAIANSMTEEEVDELERRINAANEWVDEDAGRNV